MGLRDKTEKLREKFRQEAENAFSSGILKKAVLSKRRDKSLRKTVITVFIKDREIKIKAETFRSDGKAVQKILSPSQALDFICGEALSDYRQIDLISENRCLEALISDKGALHLTGTLKGSEKANVSLSQDKEKNIFLPPKPTESSFTR